VINVIKRRGDSESFEPDRIRRYSLWAVINVGYTLKEKKEIITDFSDCMIGRFPRKTK
jgi:hypothetical protein